MAAGVVATVLGLLKLQCGFLAEPGTIYGLCLPSLKTWGISYKYSHYRIHGCSHPRTPRQLGKPKSLTPSWWPSVHLCRPLGHSTPFLYWLLFYCCNGTVRQQTSWGGHVIIQLSGCTPLLREVRAESWRQALKQKPRKSDAYWLAQSASFSFCCCFSFSLLFCFVLCYVYECFACILDVCTPYVCLVPEEVRRGLQVP